MIVDREHLFPDNWIYVHDPDVRVSRIENVKNWTDGLLPDLTRTPLGMEYFVDVGDNLWEQPDEDIVRQASEELVTLGFIDDTFEVIDGMVTRMPLTYCVHDGEYAGRVSVMREFTDSFTNLQPVGRYGMFKYNNQDHSILTGLLAGRNVAHGASHDIWSVNTDAVYHEA